MSFYSQFLLVGFAWLLVPAHTCAQESMRWGKIPEEDLTMTVYEADTTASAVVLGEVGFGAFEFGQETYEFILNRHRRVKILRSSGFGYGDIAMVYQSAKRQEVLSGLKAQIIQPDGKKHALERKDFFEEKLDDRLSRVTFSFPGLQEGSIIEYAYELRTKGIFSLPEWYFQGDIPVRMSEYTIEFPDFLNYVTLWNGRPPDVKRNEEILITLNKEQVPGQTYYVACYNLPGLKPEAYITTMDDYLTRVRFQLNAIKQSGSIRSILTDWRTLARELNGHPSLGLLINYKTHISKAYEQLPVAVLKAENKEETMKAIYNFVVSKMNWNGIKGVFASGTLNQCFENKKGSAAEINLLLIGLLRQFDIPAQPLLVGTRSFGKPIETYPIVEQFNYLLAYVELQGKTYLLDATNPFSPIGLPPIEALNGRGWVAEKNNPRWIDIQAPRASAVRAYQLSKSPDGDWTGHVKASHEGYYAIDIRKELFKAESSDQVSDNKESDSGLILEIDSVEIKNDRDPDKPLLYSAHFHLQNELIETGNLLYVPSMLEPIFKDNPFKLIYRQYPVDIPYPIAHRYILNFQVPEEYQIESLPEAGIINLPNNGGKFTFQVSLNQDVRFTAIQITSAIQINQLRFEPEEYPFIKQFFDLILAKQQELIVLKKI